jgi:predicted DNA-binding protein YlxM (UPF0122 family)
MDEKNCEFHGTVMEKINNTAEKVSDMKEDLELFKKEVRRYSIYKNSTGKRRRKIYYYIC